MEEVVERERRADVREEAAWERAKKAEIAPSDQEVDESIVDHAVFRSWCPRCVKCREESCGHVRKAQDEDAAPTVGVDYEYTRNEQKEAEKGMPFGGAQKNSCRRILRKSVM